MKNQKIIIRQLILKMKTLKDFNFKNKSVLVRCDFNVSLDKNGLISDDSRIKQTIPTIEYLLKEGAKIILISHLNRPKGKDQKYSLIPVSLRLGELLKRKIKFLNDCIGEEVEKEIDKIKVGEIILLENLRFYKEEKENDESFAKKLAKLGEIYINDAFAASHRNHASIARIPKHLPSGMGLLLEKEVKVLSEVLENPWRPLVAVIGGVKIATKIRAIEKLLEKADHLLLAGGIANVVLGVKGISIGQPFPEKETIKKIKEINLTNPKLHLPIDGVISLGDIKNGLEEGYSREAALGTVREEERVYDIGPETVKIFSEIIKSAKMIIFAGPLGMFENDKFKKGTKEIAEVISRNHSAFKIAGGGDTISALNQFNLIDKFDHISTGGGAMLEFLAGEKLPGLEALRSGR